MEREWFYLFEFLWTAAQYKIYDDWNAWSQFVNLKKKKKNGEKIANKCKKKRFIRNCDSIDRVHFGSKI